MKAKALVQNLSTVAVSAGVALLLCEFGVRQFLNPADYLSVDVVRDSVLGAVPAHTANGFDSWGFRNAKVPDRADIVALGDSHTYGNTATMDDSWPYVLGRLAGKRVYNMGLGGYGPNQYSALLTKALTLKPKMVLCGIYMGDDFENSFLITYGLEHWAYLRERSFSGIDPNIWQTSEPVSWHKPIRSWLSGHSVVYQLLVHGPLMGAVLGNYQIRNASRSHQGATTLNVSDKNILETFHPFNMLLRLDQQSPPVREGMRISFQLLKDMNDKARQRGSDFVVVIIPTKEMVFSDYIENNKSIENGSIVDRVLANERIARKTAFEFLDDTGIEYVDTLPALKRAVVEGLYVRAASDMHPNRNGYRVIAESIFAKLQQKTSLSAPSGER